jgi:hypothetical protein
LSAGALGRPILASPWTTCAAHVRSMGRLDAAPKLPSRAHSRNSFEAPQLAAEPLQASSASYPILISSSRCTSARRRCSARRSKARKLRSPRSALCGGPADGVELVPRPARAVGFASRHSARRLARTLARMRVHSGPNLITAEQISDRASVRDRSCSNHRLFSGGGGIRTHGSLSTTPVFKFRPPVCNGWHRAEVPRKQGPAAKNFGTERHGAAPRPKFGLKLGPCDQRKFWSRAGGGAVAGSGG